MQRSVNKKVIFSTKFIPLGPNVRGIIKKHLHILKKSVKAKELFPEGVMVMGTEFEGAFNKG